MWVYIAKSRQRYYKTLNNIMLHVPNHALKDMYMLNYGIIKIRTVRIIFFVIKFFYHIISPKQTHLVFRTFLKICPTIFEWWHGWRKRTIFKKQKFGLRVLDEACFFPQPGVAYKKACSSIEVQPPEVFYKTRSY